MEADIPFHPLDETFRNERHVSGDAPDWACFLFMYSFQAFGRASTECIGGIMRPFFMHWMVWRRIMRLEE